MGYQNSLEMNKTQNGGRTVQNISFYVCLIFTFVFLAFFMGFATGRTLTGLGLNFTLTIDLDSAFFSRSDVLYPYGLSFNEAFGLIFIERLWSLSGLDTEAVFSLAELTLYSISFFALYKLLRALCKNRWIIIPGLAIWYMSPFVITYIDIAPMLFGLLLLPLSILTDLKIFQKIHNERPGGKTLVKYFSFIIISRIFFVSIGWYTAIIAASGSCLFWLLVALDDIKQRGAKRSFLFWGGTICLPWIIACIIIMLLMPAGTSSQTSSLEFINGNSVDLITLFVPSDDQMIGNIINVSDFLAEGKALTGDDNTWKNYLGWGMFLTVLITVLRRRKSISKYWYFLGFSAGILFIISLGPSLKFLQTTEEAYGTYEAYLLSIESSGLVFPWYKIFTIFPFTMMRTNYRWLAYPVFMLILAFFRCIDSLWAEARRIRRKALLVGTVLLALVEYYPADGISGEISRKISYYDQLEELNSEVISELSDIIPEESLVSFCTYDYSTNASFVPYITEKCNIISYTGAGDKAMALADQYIPAVIKEMQTCSDAEQLAELISEALEMQLCDYVVLPYYSLNLYRWPAEEEEVEHACAIAAEVMSLIGDSYSVYEGEYHLIISKDQDENVGYELLQDSENVLSEVTTKNHLFGTKTAYFLEADEEFSWSTDLDEDNAIYLQTYLMADSQCSIQVAITQLEGDTVIKTEEITIEADTDFSLYELSYTLENAVTEVRITMEAPAENGIYIKNLVSNPFSS